MSLLSCVNLGRADSQVPQLTFAIEDMVITQSCEPNGETKENLIFSGVVSNASDVCVVFHDYNCSILPRHIRLSLHKHEVFKLDPIVLKISIAENFRVSPGKTHTITAKLRGQSLCRLEDGEYLDWCLNYNDVSAGKGSSWMTNFTVIGTGKYMMRPSRQPSL